MNPENNKILSDEYDKLVECNATQDEINETMGKLCQELEYCEQSEIQAEHEAAFETYLESLPGAGPY